MKKIIYLMMAFVTLTLLTGCNDKKYVGSKVEKTLSVLQNGELVLEEKDVDWKIERNAEDGTYTLFMNKTHFVEAMPRLDMEVRGMVNQTTTTDFVFKYATDATVPFYNGEDMPQFVMRNFLCEISISRNAQIRFSCVGHDVIYSEIWTDIYE